MNSIAVTKPDMAVVRRDRLGLSLFGLLALAFGNEISSRSTWNAGWYREVPLDLLEQEEAAPAVPTNAEPVQIKVDVKGMLEKLQKEQPSVHHLTKTEERILERVYLLERRIERQTSVYPHMTVHLEPIQRVQQAGPHPHGGNAGSEKERSQLEEEKRSFQSGGAVAKVEKQLIRMLQNGVQSDRGRTAMRVTQLESLGQLSAPLTPLVFSTSAPSEGGWAPRWQEEHPGFPQKGTQQEHAPAAGSILLPDLLRQRRKQAADDSELLALHADDGLLHRTATGEQPQGVAGVQRRNDGMRELVQRLDRAVDQAIARSQTHSPGNSRAASRQEKPIDRIQDIDLNREASSRAINRPTVQAIGDMQPLAQHPNASAIAVQDGLKQPDSVVQASRLAASTPQTDGPAGTVAGEQIPYAAQAFGADGAGQMARPIRHTDAMSQTTEEELYHRQEQALEAQSGSSTAVKTDAQLRTDTVSSPQSHDNTRTVQTVRAERATAEQASNAKPQPQQGNTKKAQSDSGGAAKTHTQPQTDAVPSTPSQHDPRTVQVIAKERAEVERSTSEELHYRQEAEPSAQPSGSVAAKEHIQPQTDAVPRTPSQHDPRTVQVTAKERAEMERSTSEALHYRQEAEPAAQPSGSVAAKEHIQPQTDVVSRIPSQHDPRTVQAIAKEHAAVQMTSEALHYRQDASPEARLDSSAAAKAHAPVQADAIPRTPSHNGTRSAQMTDRGRTMETARVTEIRDDRTPHGHQIGQKAFDESVIEDKSSASHTSALGESKQNVSQTVRAVARPAETKTVQPAEILQHRTPIDESMVLQPADANQSNKQTMRSVAKRTVSPMTGHPVQAHRSSPMRPYRAAETVLRPIASTQQAMQAIGRTGGSPAEPVSPAFGGETLTYLPVQNETAAATHAAETAAALHQNTAQLPDWAQRFLQQPMQPTSTAQQGSAVQHPTAVGAQPPTASRTAAQQIEWTAPNAVSPAASIVYAEHKPQPAQPQPQAMRLSDSELHRAADKVYRIIEERLRKELRRSGK